MKLTFIVHRTNYYKFYGPLIKAALERDWVVACWLCQETGGKEYLVPTRENLPNFGNHQIETRIFHSDGEVKKALQEMEKSVAISLHPKIRYLQTADGSETYFVTLQHGIDTFIEANAADLSSSDLLCLYAPFWAEWGARYYEANGKTDLDYSYDLISNKVVFAGFPQMDALEEIDPDEVRARFGIDAKRPVVLLLPITLANKGGAWPRFFEAGSQWKQFMQFLRAIRSEGWKFAVQYWFWALNGWNDKALTSSIVKFCQHNNAQLIAKGRGKDQMRPWLEKQADLAIYDEAYYPATILELLSIADVCIHFYSFASLEAADAGVFGISVDRPSPSVGFGKPAPAYHQLWRGKDEGSAFNFPGVNRWMDIPEMITKLPSLDIDAFEVDSAARSEYLQKYLGIKDHQASEHILNLIAEQN